MGPLCIGNYHLVVGTQGIGKRSYNLRAYPNQNYLEPEYKLCSSNLMVSRIAVCFHFPLQYLSLLNIPLIKAHFLFKGDEMDTQYSPQLESVVEAQSCVMNSTLKWTC